MGARKRVEREVRHASDGGKRAVEAVVQFERALHRAVGLQRMHVAESRHSRNFLVDFRVVFHRAAAQRVEARVDTEIHIRQVGVVAHHVEFAHLRQFSLRVASQRRRQSLRVGAPCVFRQREAATSRLRQLEYQFVVVFHS